jgi:hypothetical protein
MQDCRNCGSHDLRELGFVGEVAPFFLKRVLNLEIGDSQARHPLRLLARRLGALPQRLFSRIYGCAAYAEMQICSTCSFIQTKHAFPDDALGRLYADYRSATYNEERIRYEPSYAALAGHIGIDAQEVSTRVAGLTAWLAGRIDPGDGFSMLDFGGSDGRFLPTLRGEKYVFEISDIPPRGGITRIPRESDLGVYSYVQMAHLLEHVSEPLAMVKRVSSFVRPSGHLYIEVPQDLADAEIAGLKNGPVRRSLTVHEHINVYCLSSITRLVEAARLDLVDSQSVAVDLGWTTCTIIRALCRRPA